jgi:hypothetical protein
VVDCPITSEAVIMATPAKGTPSHPAHATATAPEASKDNDGDHPLDVNVLKELARRALIDALNSVCIAYDEPLIGF